MRLQDDSCATEILVINPYWSERADTWVFDDQSRDLCQERFVNGTPEIINNMVQDIPSARSGFTLKFSDQEFPGSNRVFEHAGADLQGNWYWDEATDGLGWLCPALYKYFDTAPEQIFARAERVECAEVSS